jgi:hypothetical protein
MSPRLGLWGGGLLLGLRLLGARPGCLSDDKQYHGRPDQYPSESSHINHHAFSPAVHRAASILRNDTLGS